MRKLCKEQKEIFLTLKMVAWSDSSSGISLRIAWISSGWHFCLIALTSLADIIQVIVFSVSGTASYLNVGSGLSGAKPRNDSGILSTTRWWYESLKRSEILKKKKAWWGLSSSALSQRTKEEGSKQGSSGKRPRKKKGKIGICEVYLRQRNNTSLINLGLGCSGSNLKESSQSSQDHLNWKLLKW